MSHGFEDDYDFGPRLGVDYDDHEDWERAPCPACQCDLAWIYCNHPSVDVNDDMGTPGWPECPQCYAELWPNRNRAMGRLSRVEEILDEAEPDPDSWDEPDPAADAPDHLPAAPGRRDRLAALMAPPPPPPPAQPPTRRLIDVIQAEIDPSYHEQVARLALIYSLAEVEMRASMDCVLLALCGWTLPVLVAKAEGRFHD